MSFRKKLLIWILGFILSLENIILAMYTASAINILGSDELSSLLKLSLITAMSLILIFGIKILFQQVKHREIGKINVKARKDLMKTLLSDTEKELTMNMLFNDIKFLEDNYYDKKISQYLEVISFILSLVVSLWLGWQATVIIVSLSLLSIFLPKLLQSKLNEKTNEWSDENNHYMDIVKDIFNGNQTIHNYFASDYFYKKHNIGVSQLEERNIKLKVFQKLVEFITFSCSHFAIISMVMVSGWLVVKGKMEIGNIIGIIQLSNSITFPLVSFVQNRNLIQSSIDILKKQKKFIEWDQKENIMENKDVNQIEVIQLSNLNYNVNENNILSNINITINKGEKILIVGPSGSGKTTLLSLLRGDNWDNTEGEITVNNEKVNPEVLRKLTSRIMQDYYIFEDTFLNNICFGKSYDDESIKKSIRMAQLAELLEKKGSHYELKENGKNISGGQRQRIEIARTLIRNKPILLIDEGLSSLDSITAGIIEETILSDEQRTVVHITHHVSEDIIDKYDKIINVEDGKISNLSAMGENI